MIADLPNWVHYLFIGTFVTTLLFFYYANGRSKLLFAFLIVWSAAQALLANEGFYMNNSGSPPRVFFLLFPIVLLIIYGLMPRQRRWYTEVRDQRISTISHIVRLPVEIVLFGLFVGGLLPELMTFEGRNYDILIGITAPIVGFLWIKGMISKKILLIWNVIGLAFVLFIMVNGILSVETPFQQFAFDQPNEAVLHFPYILLPAVIVPIVIWTHISDIILLKS